MNDKMDASAKADHAFVPSGSSPQAVLPVPASIVCARCVVLEDLLNTATSDRDKARDESTKADEETLALKVRDVGRLAEQMTGSYSAIKAFQHRAEKAEVELKLLRGRK